MLLAFACGLIAANIYYAQPLIGPISADLGLSEQAGGLIVTLTQIGYGVGLLLVVPLADLFENRRLAISILAIGATGLVISGFATSAALFLSAAVLVGLGSVTVQILVPYAAHLSPEVTRGRVVGNVMSGLMLGIMLARPVASLITHYSAWRVIFCASFVAVLALALVLRVALPPRPVQARMRYHQMLASMVELVRTTPELRRRALYHACMFGAFSLFWTTTPLLLAGPEFGLTQKGIAWFALAGVAGAIAAPIAGRVADRGWIRQATAMAMLMSIGAFAMTHIGARGTPLALAMLVVAGITLDFAVSANLVLGQRIIFS
ncbi:MFS transporter [Variovorax sp. J31P179]|uniref:MFS transporter n=1 Tax=Variovorax sp. J31P179 TaxID=3053508 RepID=UPI003365A6FE